MSQFDANMPPDAIPKKRNAGRRLIASLSSLLFGPIGVGAARLLSVREPQRWIMASESRGRLAARLVALVAILLSGASCGPASSSQPQNRPSVILISIDTLRADHIHGYGYGPETTPTLDALMRRGVSFTNAITSAPWTLPSHMSLFTSLYPHTHGVTAELLALGEGVAVLAEPLKEAGYKTAGFATMPHLSPRHGFGRGFDLYICEEVRAPVALERGLKWLGQAGSEDFFLFLHLFDVHSDYAPLPHYLKMFESSYEGDIDGKGETLYKVRAGDISLSEEDLRHLVALYDAEIRQLDSALEMFFNALEKRDMLSDTIIIITSDHGEEFLDHGGVLHGQTLYDELVKVPLIVAGPGIPEGKSIGKQVQLIDVMPTILELCGAGVPSKAEGRSLLPLIQKDDADWEELAFAEADWRNVKQDIKRAVRTGEYKLYYDRYTKREELYNLRSDPGEKHNILEERPDVADSLRKELRRWMAAERGSPARITLPEKEKERLRALGYLN